ARRPKGESLGPFRAGRVLARYHTGRALSAYRDIGPRPETFRQLANLAWGDHDDALLESLLDAHAKYYTDIEDLLTFRYRLALRRQQVPEAIGLFKALLARPLPDERRSVVVNHFLVDAAEAGRPVEGYRAAPDAPLAFWILAPRLLAQERIPELRRLLEAHR